MINELLVTIHWLMDRLEQFYVIGYPIYP